MADDFCKNLSNSVYFQEKNGELFYQPCCWVPLSPMPIKSKIDLTIARAQLTTSVKSDKEKNCAECLGRERNGFNRSHRIAANNLIPDDAKNGDPYTLTLQIDTTCNAACVTCGPHFSSLWKKQIDPTATLDDYESQYQALYDTVDFTSLRKILFVGGEPLLSAHNDHLLSRVPDPSVVQLNYTTNGSVFPNENIINLWKKFKEVTVVFSIDGTEEQFEYIRWPLSWKKINENFHRFVELSNEINFTFTLNTTINPLNIYYFDRIEEWSKSFPILRILTSGCYGTWGIDGTPQSMRKYIEEKYGSNHKLVGLLKSYPEHTEKFPLLLEHARQLDTKRKLNYEEVFKESLKIINQ